MDVIIISKENNLLYISNEDRKIDYTVYNKKGHLIDGGVLENDEISYDIKKVFDEIVSSFKDTISFSEPYVYIDEEDANNLLELIEEEDYNNSQNKIAGFWEKDVIENDGREI